MKARLAILFTALLFLLSACSVSSNCEKTLSDTLSSLDGASYTAKITANFPSREAEFTINCTYSHEETRASVITPSEVAGTSYTMSGDDAFLEFDGAILEIGKLDESGVSPFSAIHTLIRTWKAGAFSEVTNSVMHGKAARLAISREEKGAENIEYRTWFSKDTSLPLYSEIFSDGKRVITCEFERAEHKTK